MFFDHRIAGASFVFIVWIEHGMKIGKTLREETQYVIIIIILLNEVEELIDDRYTVTGKTFEKRQKHPRRFEVIYMEN